MDLSGLGSALGDIGSTMLGGYFNKKEAKKGREFTERMDNTRYQRAADDLQKAGLNRILAIGSPGSAPSSAVATMGDAKAGSSYQAGSSAKAQRNVQAASEKLINEQALTQGEQQNTERAQQKLLTEQAAAVSAKLQSEIALNNANAASALTASKRGSGVAEISDAIAEVIRDIRNPPPGAPSGALPYIANKLPGAVLGERGVNSAKKAGKKLYEMFHGSIEEQSKERKEKWKKEDSQKSKKGGRPWSR